MNTATDELISAYLAELAREAARLPWSARTELLEDVRSHIEVALAEMREPGRGGNWGGGRGSGADEAGDETAGRDAADVGPGGAGSAGGVAGGDAGSAGGRSAGAELEDAAVRDIGDSGGGAGSAGDVVDAAARSAEAELSQVRAMLAALGEPSEIVAAALADDPSLAPPLPGPVYLASPVPQGPPHPLGALDIAAVTLLLFGGFLAGIGWLIGAVLLWTSPRWSRLEKLIGTLVLPGGIAGGLFALTVPTASSSTTCGVEGHCVTTHSGWHLPGWTAFPAVAIILVGPVVTAVYLVNRARRRPGPAASRAVLALMAGVGTLGVLAVVGFLFAGSSGSGSAHRAPVPDEYSGTTVPGYVVPISSPAQPSSSASTP